MQSAFRIEIRAAVLLALLVAGLLSPRGSQAAEATRIVIDTTTMTSPAMAGRVTGAFDETFGKLGVAIEYVQLSTSSQMLEGLVSSSADIVELGYVGVVTGAAARVPFTIVGSASNGGGDVLLVRKDRPVRSVTELRGKTVAVTKGASSWALLLRALDKAGLPPSAVNMINLQPDEAQNAFLTGQVDAWAVWSGSKTDAVNDGNSVTLETGAGIGLIPGQIAVRTEFLRQSPALVIAYLRARQAALDLMTRDPAGSLGAIAASRHLPVERVKTFMAVSAPVNAPVTDAQVADLQRTADLLLKLGEIRRAVNVRDVVDNRYMEQAIASK